MGEIGARPRGQLSVLLGLWLERRYGENRSQRFGIFVANETGRKVMSIR